MCNSTIDHNLNPLDELCKPHVGSRCTQAVPEEGEKKVQMNIKAVTEVFLLRKITY